MQGAYPARHTEGPVYIELPAVFLVPFGEVQGVQLCPVTVGSTGLRYGTSGHPCSPRSLPFFDSFQLQSPISHQESCIAPSVRRYNYSHSSLTMFLILMFIWPFFSCLFVEIQLLKKMMLSPSWRGCGRRWIYWRKYRRCRQVLP